MPDFLLHFISEAVGNPLILGLAIALCAFVFEDLTTVIVGVLAADARISVPLVLVSLSLGIVVGDIVLYFLGRYARTHPRLAHYIDHDFTAPFRAWLDRRYTLIIVSGHLVPGLRFTSYVASGFFHYPFARFMQPAIVGGLAFGIALFSISYWFGNVTAGWVGHARWGIAIAFLLALCIIGRRGFLTYRAAQSGSAL